MLQKNEVNLHNIIEKNSDAIVIVGGNGVVLYVNSSGELLFGRNAEELTGEHFGFPLVSGETTEIEVIGREKEVRVAEMRVVDTEWEGKKAYLATIRDITEHKKVDEFIESIFESIGEGLVVVDPEYRIVTANKAYCAQVKMPIEDIKGKLCYEVSHHINKPCFKTDKECPVRHTFTTGHSHTYIHKHTHYDKKRSPVYVEIRSYPIKDPSGNVISAIEVINDITKTFKLEKALENKVKELQESEERFRKISVTAQDAIIMINDEGNISYWNPAAEKIFGYKEGEANGKYLHKLIVPDRFYEGYKKGFEKFRDTGQGDVIGKRIELSAIRKDKTEFPIELSISSVKINDKWSAIGIIRDITNRKRAQEKIKRDYYIQSAINSILQISLEPISLDEQLERILELILSIPWLALKSKGCIYLIEDDSEMLEMKAQRSLHLSLLSTCKRIPFGKCLCGRAASTRKLIFTESVNELHEIYYEGMIPHGHYCVPVLSGNRILGVICMYVRDKHKRNKEEEEFLTAVANTLAGIIERKKAEEELQEAKNNLEIRVKERTSELTMAVELLEREIAERKKAEEELDRKRKLLHALMDNIPDSIYFKDKVNRFVEVNKAKAEHAKTPLKHMIGKTDFDFLPKNQAKKAFADDNKVMKSGNPLKDKVEKITRKNGTEAWVSVTKIPWYGEKDTIIGTIGVSRDITSRKQTEEALNKQREEFISVLIHDLKGPLLPVLGYIKRLIDGKSKSKEDTMKIFKRIQGASQDLLKIIEGTSKDLRTKSTLQSFHPEEIEFCSFLTSIVTNFAPIVEEKGLKIFINRKEKETWNELEKVYFKADPSQIATLIENLLVNAVKYAKRTILMEFNKHNSFIRFIVSDDGPGIPEKYKDKVFDEYFQVPGSKKGTGLGLYSIKKVVENHKGKITVVNPSSKSGSSFVITLPIS